MALADPALPYGLRDVKLTPIDAAGTLGTAVDLPAAQTLSFSEEEDFETLRGDDVDKAIHGKGPKVSWTLEAGGVSLDAWKVITGGTVTAAGTGSAETKALVKLNTDARPYFQIEGQAYNDNSGDCHVTIYKAKCTGALEGEFGDGAFFITKCSGEGIGDGTGQLYKFIWNETAAAIA